jgi:hypothetical protein
VGVRNDGQEGVKIWHIYWVHVRRFRRGESDARLGRVVGAVLVRQAGVRGTKASDEKSQCMLIRLKADFELRVGAEWSPVQPDACRETAGCKYNYCSVIPLFYLTRERGYLVPEAVKASKC